ncbi:hypothetical protein [Dasineura jujubifolia toursvirus 2a]|nr:hypothetical protein [Dasineura jujubifolia toursvirus 2a]
MLKLKNGNNSINSLNICNNHNSYTSSLQNSTFEKKNLHSSHHYSHSSDTENLQQLVNLKIQNPEFLICFSFIKKTDFVYLYREVENIVLGNISNKDLFLYKKQLKQLGPEEFISNLEKKIKEDINSKCSSYNGKIQNQQNTNNTATNFSSTKRKNVKDNMIENYVIKNNKGEQFLKELNIKLFLKIINSKNIIIENGDVIDVIM